MTGSDGSLTRTQARMVIEKLGGSGQPPEYGFQFFTAGLDEYLNVLRDDYLASLLPDGGSTFKMVVGVYGGGKTHFLYSVREIAWEKKFAVAHVSLSPGESPFHRLELVYQQIAKSIVPPLSPEELLAGYEKGVASLIHRWYLESYREAQALVGNGGDLDEELSAQLKHVEGFESLSFSKALQAAFRARMRNDDDAFLSASQWLIGEGYDSKVHKPMGILHKVDKTTAFTMLRSLTQWVRAIGYQGIVILLDEAERTASLSSRQRETLLGNLREVIDECGQSSFQGVMMLYAIPDESFLEGGTQIYEALRQRVSTVFDVVNPSGVKIELERLHSEPEEFLREVGAKLVPVYETAYDTRFDESQATELVSVVAKDSYSQRYKDAGYKRIFVQELVKGMHYLRTKGEVPPMEDLE